MVSKTDTKQLTPGELVYEMFSEVYCTVSAFVENDSITGSAAATNVVAGKNPVGLPVKLNGAVWEFANEANVDAGTVHGIIIDDDPVLGADNLGLAAGAFTLTKRRILVKGPATIIDNNIPTEDIYGTDFDATAKANYIAALKVLDVITKDSAGLSSQQTT